ncbi:MAG: redoxin domain-containing protein [Chloroflexi bacterium]|nr:redoxin domain-containing protein [Chloroflexota bacterium]
MLIGVFALAAVACGRDTEPIENTGAPSSSDAPAPAVEEASNLPAAPDFTLPAANRNSTEISLSQFQGDKPVVLVFYRAYW